MEAEVCPEHIHMPVEIPRKAAVSSFVGFLRGKSRLPLYGKFPELKYKYRAREFWCRGYYVDPAGKDAIKIAEHIKHQLDEGKEERAADMPLWGGRRGDGARGLARRGRA